MAKAQTPYRMTKIDEIRPYDKNPRIIPQAAVDAVARSIQAFGFRQPIVVDGQGVILAGHTRYKAAQQLGLTEVPVVWQTDIDEIRAKGYRIADNKTAEISAWDRDQLDKEVQDIAAQCDFDIKDLGLADWEIQRILDTSANVTDKFDPVSFSGQGSPMAVYKPTDTGIPDDHVIKQPDTDTTAETRSEIRCPFCGNTFNPSFVNFDPAAAPLQDAAGSSVRKVKK